VPGAGVADMRDDVTVARVLRRAFAMLVLLIVVSGGSGAAATLLQHQTVTRLTDHVLPLQLANAELRGVLADGQRGLRGYLLTSDTTLLDTYYVAHSGYFLAAQDMRRLAAQTENPSIEEQVRRADAWWALAENQRRSQPRSDEAARYVAEGRPLFLAFESANSALDEQLGARADALRAESRTLGILTTAGLIALTAAATLVAALTALRTTRRITGPLSRLGTVINRLRAGEEARAPVDDGPAEIRAVAGAVNTMADDAARIRGQDEVVGQLRQEIRALNTRIRQHLSVETAMQEAASGLAGILHADHALVRIAARDADDRTVASCSTDGAAGTLDPLAAVDTAWLSSGDIVVAVEPADVDLPPAEVQGWLAAGAGPLVTVAVSNGEERLGAVTLLRAAGQPAWTPTEVRLAESVAADLGRGVHQARLFEQEQHLVAQLKELDTAKTDFMSTVSHELRTPLTSISGYLELMLDEDAGELSPPQRRMLEVIARNTRRLRELIEDMLILSKIEAGGFRISKQDVELSELVDHALAAIEPAAAKASVGLHTEVYGPLRLTADPEQLDRVLTNLLSNAVKFTPPEGTVTVRAVREGEELVLTVADTGMGIPEAEQQALFARFFRASNAIHQAIPGTGLGLAIVRTIVDNHGGTIEVRSTEKVGTTVTVRLPVQ
jgi:two-component system phosphate regulon sensor histidine kinase PhoR